MIDVTRAVIFLDGLDEVSPQRRESLETEINNFIHLLQYSKVIVSCRSGDWNGRLEKFVVVEVCPLTNTQISKICKSVCNEPDEFLLTLDKLPFRDVCDRPLLLHVLIILFSKYQSLPNQVSDIYEKLIRTLIEDWDAENGVLRKTKYAGFLPDRKMRYLSSLSFNLLNTNGGIKTFSTRDIVKVYKRICKQFSLPEDEAEKVANEIESHTGILVACGMGYEFSHYSIQEYLAARYLIQHGGDKEIVSFYNFFPGIVAVAVSASLNPTDMFSIVILNNLSLENESALQSFFSRLWLESPKFESNEIFGAAFIKILSHFYKKDKSHLPDYIKSCISLIIVRDAICNALIRFFGLRFIETDTTILVRNEINYLDSSKYDIPQEAILSTSLVTSLLKKRGYKLYKEDTGFNRIETIL